MVKATCINFPIAIHLFLTSNYHPDQSQEQNFLDSFFYSVLIILSELKKMGGRGKIVAFWPFRSQNWIKLKKMYSPGLCSMLQSCTATSSHHQASHDQTDIGSDCFAHSLVLEQGSSNRYRRYTFSYHTTLPISFNNVL